MRVNSISASGRVAELVVFITKRYEFNILQVYILYTNNIYLEEEINRFYNDVDESLGKPNHYTIYSGGRLQCANRDKNRPYGNGNRQINLCSN